MVESKKKPPNLERNSGRIVNKVELNLESANETCTVATHMTR